MIFYFATATLADIVVYLLHMKNFATLEKVKNYKSLQSFKYFTNG